MRVFRNTGQLMFLKNKKYIILMYFRIKSTLKNNCNYTLKHAFNLINFKILIKMHAKSIFTKKKKVSNGLLIKKKLNREEKEHNFI